MSQTKSLTRYRLLYELVLILTWRDIKIRYKQSIMGSLWAIFMPALIVGAGLLVRSAMSHLSGHEISAVDVASLATKALPWAFFVSGIRFGTQSLAANANLITKINVPRVAFPLSAVFSSFMDFLIALLPLGAILFFCGVRPTVMLAWMPVLVGVLFLQVCGLSIVFAIGNLFFRDVKYIVEVVLTFAIFFTPVLYEASALGDVGKWLMFNPIAPLLEGLRSCVVLGEQPQLIWISYSIIVSTVFLASAWMMFSRLEGVFADYV